MIYFSLDLKNYIGEKHKIGYINSSFFSNIFKLENVEVHSIGLIPPEFNIKISNTLIEGIDNENSIFTTEDIIKFMKEAHRKIIPGINKSLDELGIKYEFIKEIPNKDVERIFADYMAENNFEFVCESVINKATTLEDKIEIISKELSKIGAMNNVLTIMDPYALHKKYPHDYWDFLIGFIKKSGIKKLKLIVSSKANKYSNTSHEILENKMNELSIPLKVLKNDNFHDRVFIVESNKKGVLCGCSLNGIGRNTSCIICEMNEEDIDEIIKTEIKQSVKLSLTRKSKSIQYFLLKFLLLTFNFINKCT